MMMACGNNGVQHHTTVYTGHIYTYIYGHHHMWATDHRVSAHFCCLCVNICGCARMWQLATAYMPALGPGITITNIVATCQWDVYIRWMYVHAYTYTYMHGLGQWRDAEMPLRAANRLFSTGSCGYVTGLPATWMHTRMHTCDGALELHACVHRPLGRPACNIAYIIYINIYAFVHVAHGRARLCKCMYIHVCVQSISIDISIAESDIRLPCVDNLG